VRFMGEFSWAQLRARAKYMPMHSCGSMKNYEISTRL
jgi:hypothetical protein